MKNYEEHGMKIDTDSRIHMNKWTHGSVTVCSKYKIDCMEHENSNIAIMVRLLTN